MVYETVQCLDNGKIIAIFLVGTLFGAFIMYKFYYKKSITELKKALQNIRVEYEENKR